MKYTKEVKVGILTITAIVLSYYGYNYLKGSNILEDNRVYYAVYENVEGLTKSAPVTINGLKVGNIDDIKFLDDRGRLLVTFHVNGDFSFSSESTASVYSMSLIGGKGLAIIPNFDSEAPQAVSGDTLRSVIDKGIEGQVMDQFVPLKDKIESMVVSADSALTVINKTLNPQSRKLIASSLEELQKTLVDFSQITDQTASLLDNNKEQLDNTLKNLEVTTSNFAQVSDSIAKIEFAATVHKLETSLDGFNGVLNKINKGEGTLGKLVQDDQLYSQLERTAKQAGDLLQDMKLNPKRYVHFSVFGKKAKEYDAPEDPRK